ncbi:dihydrodipicolinate synthase family protein [Nocardia sp. NEAU-G5]|uniref:Dihydrodipicolinate synthase family protein n=1 Tax=Nocardia albiluteola TaxID=2842303 RepID=A0ABS6AYF1_9NOCA|nr:dihydrodipicolinate synthase family protein [Nocardia albiluteola]MBU3063067.1 dihydrodipicolinate synthase family protein [Nocardia albiluteola]
MTTTVRPGVWGVLATPFTGSALDVDNTGVARLAEHAQAAGVTGLTVLGVFGEAARLSWAERRIVLETVLDSTDLPLVVGCTALATAPVVDEARMAVEVAGDRLAGVMVHANSGDRATLHAHLSAVHQASGAPIVIQDYPAVSSVAVSPSMLGDLVAACDFVAAVKAESPPTPVAVAEVTARCDVPVFGGLGGINLLDELAAGAAGAMTGFSYPEALVACVRAWFAQEPAKSRAELLDYLPLITFEQQAGIALAIRKECLRRRGLIAESAVRPPARALPDALHGMLAEHLAIIERGR